MNSNGLTPAAAYTARTKTWGELKPVDNTDLNAIQDGIMDTSSAVDDLSEKVAPSVMGSSWLAETVTPDEFGGFSSWNKQRTNGVGGVVVLDDSRDYRDRFLQLHGHLIQVDAGGMAVQPGEADDNYWPTGTVIVGGGGTTTATGVEVEPQLFYAHNGQDGTGPTGTAACSLGDSTVGKADLFARDTDGALCLVRRSVGSVELDLYLVVHASPQLNQY